MKPNLLIRVLPVICVIFGVLPGVPLLAQEQGKKQKHTEVRDGEQTQGRDGEKTQGQDEVTRTDTLKTAVVTADKLAQHSRTATGLTRLDMEALNQGFALFGSPDLIKRLQMLPGVSAGVELMSGLYVHGGDGTDNLYLLDDVPLFQVSHLAGLFSSFNTDVIDNVDFYKSGFPSRYGGRLSSVVDVTTSDGDFNKYKGTFSLGIIDGRLSFGGPIVKDKLSFNVAMRRTWLDVILTPMMWIMNRESEDKVSGSYSMTDLNASLAWKASANDKLSLRLYAGLDRTRMKNRSIVRYNDEFTGEETMGILMRWGNSAVSADWKHRFSDTIKLDTKAYWSRGFSNLSTSAESTVPESEMQDHEMIDLSAHGSTDAFGARSDLSLRAGRNQISCGILYQHNLYTPTSAIFVNGGDVQMTFNDASLRLNSDEVTAYAEDLVTWGPLSLTAGLRLSLWLTKGKTFFRPQPRFSLSYNLKDLVTFKASYSEMAQFSHLLSSLFMDLPTNIWMPSCEAVAPSYSRQVAVGISSPFAKGWHLDVEGYFKTMDNCLIYSGNLSPLPEVKDWETKVMQGQGRSYGAEVEIGYSGKKAQATLYYTLSWNERLFTELYDDWFYDRFDNRHKLTIEGMWRISRKVDISAAWTYHSGNRVTLPEQTVDPDGTGEKVIIPVPYNAQMPDYHRLDLSLNFRKTTRRGNERIWNVSIYNAYCRMNPFMMMSYPDENGKYIAETYSMIPIIPSVSYTLKF